MNDQSTPTPTNTSAAESARQRAAEMIAAANTIADAVDKFHTAQERLIAAEQERASASSARDDALRMMRDAGCPLSEMGDLTGLSSSRISALIKR